MMSNFGFLECFDRYEGVGWVAKGWASLGSQNDPINLLLIIDGRVSKKFSASLSREDLFAAGLHSAKAFEILMPEFVANGLEHHIAVVFEATEEHLRASPQRFIAPRFRGRIERVSGLVVEGWALDTMEPERPVVLELEIDDIFQELIIANEIRYDLSLALGTSGFNSFRTHVPSRFCDGLNHKLRFRVANTDYTLDGKDIQIRFREEVVPDVIRKREAELRERRKRLEELSGELLKAPINELSDYQIYNRWIHTHEENWKEYFQQTYPDSFASPFFSLLPDSELENEMYLECVGEYKHDVDIVEYSSDGRSFRDAVLSAKGQYLIFPGITGLPDRRALTILHFYLVRSNTALLYTDDDVLLRGERTLPRFKPCWDLERFLGVDYIGRAVAIRRDVAWAAIQQGGLIQKPDDLIVATLLSVQDDEVERLPLVLFHTIGEPIPEEPLLRRERLLPWIKPLWRDIDLVDSGNVLKISRRIPKPSPKVTLIIPTRDKVNLLKNCIESVLNATNYENYDIIVVDNGSTQRETFEYFDCISINRNISIIGDGGNFNYSRINNFAASKTNSPLICLLNNDIVAHDGNWLSEMVSHAIQPHVGAVGAKLLYPDGLLQHGGVVVGFHGAADNSHRGISEEQHGYGYALRVTQRVSAVTAACLVCRREVFLAVGGLDEANFPVAFNDVDFCLRLRKKGYQIIWTPYAELFHHESASRRVSGNLANLEREQQEANELISRWNIMEYIDPYYSPNLNRTGISTHSAFAP